VLATLVSGRPCCSARNRRLAYQHVSTSAGRTAARAAGHRPPRQGRGRTLARRPGGGL